jgi:peptidoglycan/LPS O-acetylase OafA/YrhL
MRQLVGPTAEGASTNLAYRPDIDGLRAVAVISVVIFHAIPEWLQGGFIGVDIFFVISGFLISGIIFGALEAGNFTFSEFYGRRIRRIFPSLCLVILSVYTLGWFVLLSDEFYQLGRHIAAGSGFASNLLLWSETGYFDTDSFSKPLLHLWSLGIEEQFYIVWPLLVWIAWRFRLRIPKLVLILCLTSFCLNVTLIRNNPTAAFYSPLTRAWELLAGGLLALVSSGKVYSDRSANLLSTLGALLLTLGFMLIRQSMVFPGFWAILPVSGATLLILAGPRAWLNRWVLSSKFMVWLGLISFPLYLWHWPLISLMSMIAGEKVSLAARLWSIGISIVLSILTYCFIERPIRFGSKKRPKVIGLVAIMAMIGCLGCLTSFCKGFPSRSINSVQGQQLEDLQRTYDNSVGWLCSNTEFKFGHCHFTSETPEIVILGDSHAQALFFGVKRYAPQAKVAMVGNAGCPPFLNIISRDKYRVTEVNKCADGVSKAIPFIATTPSARRIILSFRGTLYVSGKGFGEGWDWIFSPHDGNQQDTQLRAEELLEARLKEVLGLLTNADKEILFVIDQPELGFDSRKCLDSRPYRSLLSTESFKCKVTRSAYDKRSAQYRKLITRVLEQFPSVEVIDAAQALCDNQFCYAKINNRILYSDDDHLSPYGAFRVLEQSSWF